MKREHHLVCKLSEELLIPNYTATSSPVLPQLTEITKIPPKLQFGLHKIILVVEDAQV